MKGNNALRGLGLIQENNKGVLCWTS